MKLCEKCGYDVTFDSAHSCQTSYGPIVNPNDLGVKAKAAPSALDNQVAGNHYRTLKIQPIEYIHANGIPFAEGSVIKYVTRWRDKGGIKDLEKAKHFIEMLIELESRKE